MVAAAATPLPLASEPQALEKSPCDLAFGDRVWTRAGDAGRVAGFYRTRTPTVLVRLDSGWERQYARDQLTS
jgi:hypothetical protein